MKNPYFRLAVVLLAISLVANATLFFRLYEESGEVEDLRSELRLALNRAGTAEEELTSAQTQLENYDLALAITTDLADQYRVQSSTALEQLAAYKSELNSMRSQVRTLESRVRQGESSPDLLSDLTSLLVLVCSVIGC
ncbi:MAG: hypothetical protein V3U79_09650 [Dehalococcoidia bacterium]